MEALWRETVSACRRLRSAPVFTAFAVITLALGIGATTAIYSVVYAAVLRPPAMREVDRVANLYHMDPRRGGSGPMISLSLPDFEDYRARQRSFAALAPWARFQQPLVSAGAAEVIMGEMVGGDYFSVVGVDAALGRTIQPADTRPGAPRVVVLSDRLWRRLFAADPAVIGRVVSLGGEPAEIIGVAPAWFRGVDVPNVLPTPAWIPLDVANAPGGPRAHDREHRWIRAIGRLAPGQTMEEALTEFRTIGQALDATDPIGRNDGGRRSYRNTRRWFLLPVAEIRMHESTHAVAGPLATTILIAVGLVLLVACTNVANLMLARGSARRQELAVRLALGASHLRLAREQIVEAALVTLAGGLMAFLVARVLITRVLTLSFDIGRGAAMQVEPELNLPVALAGAAATGIALLVFGVLPALQALRANVRDALGSEGATGAAPRWRTRQSLIALQVTVSAGLVAVAVLCAQQLLADARHDPGIDLDRLAAVRFDFGLQKKSESEARQMLERVADDVRRQPGIERVALASGLPVGTGSRSVSLASTMLLKDGRLQGRTTEMVAASPEILDVLGVRLVAGRMFDARHVSGAARVIVIDETTAARLFGGTPAVGRQVYFMRQPRVGDTERPVDTATVIGVTEDTDVGVVGRRGREGAAYVPFSQEYTPGMSIIARTSSDSTMAVGALRRTVTRAEPDLAIVEAGTGRLIARADNFVAKVGAWAASLFGGLALVLAMVGLYGVLTELVQRRTREIGIRLALGAEPGRVLRMILRDGLRPVAVGLVLGAGIGALLRIAFRPMFLRLMPAFDPVLLLLVPLALLAAGLLAAYLPARRAARVEATVALRHL